MKPFRLAETLISDVPPDWRWPVAFLLVAFAALTIAGRIHLPLGAKIFSKVPPDQIRTNVVHIIGYTVMPTIVAVMYVVALISPPG